MIPDLFIRWFGHKDDHFIGFYRVGEFNPPCMQVDGSVGIAPGRTVFEVSADRGSKMRQLRPDLVMPAC